MRSQGVWLLSIGALLATVPSAANAQDPSAAEKEKAAEAEKAKAQQLAPKLMVVPPAKGSGTVTGPLNHAAPVVVPTVPLKLAPQFKLPGVAATAPAPAAATLTIPYRATTASLSAVGRGHEVAVASFTPVRLRTAAVGAVGRGPAPELAPFTPVRLHTAPLGAVGRPTGE